MIVLFPFISFLRSDQSLIFSIVDAGRTVGGVEAEERRKKREIDMRISFFRRENIFLVDDKNSKIRTIIGCAKSFFPPSSQSPKQIKLMP